MDEFGRTHWTNSCKHHKIRQLCGNAALLNIQLLDQTTTATVLERSMKYLTRRQPDQSLESQIIALMGRGKTRTFLDLEKQLISVGTPKLVRDTIWKLVKIGELSVDSGFSIKRVPNKRVRRTYATEKKRTKA